MTQLVIVRTLDRLVGVLRTLEGDVTLMTGGVQINVSDKRPRGEPLQVWAIRQEGDRLVVHEIESSEITAICRVATRRGWPHVILIVEASGALVGWFSVGAGTSALKKTA
jgi:hypothetical protein